MNKEDIINLVRELSNKKGETITRREFPYSYSIYLKYFKTWSEVLEYAGLTKNVLSHLTNEDLIKYILKYKNEFGKTPRCIDFTNLSGYPSSTKFLKAFGTWTNALKEAGLTKKSKKFEDNSIEFLLKDFEKEYKRLGCPSKREYNNKRKKSSPSSSYLEKLTEQNWNQLLKNLNFKVAVTPKKILDSKEEIIEKYIAYSQEIGSIRTGATFKELEKSDININTIRLRFGGINNLRRICGFKTKKNWSKYSKEEIIDLLKKKYIEKGRRLTHNEISKDKELPSATTICSYFFTTKINKVWEEIDDYMF